MADIGTCPDLLDPICDPVVPYGTPIRQAIASGDRVQMAQQADSARGWLAANSAHPSAGDVTMALAELESALSAL